MTERSNVVSIQEARKKRAKSKDPRVFQIKITLKGIKPPIWRRLLIRSDQTLMEFHYAIQCCMGWENAHLHDFKAGDRHYGEPDPEGWMDVIDESTVTIDAVLRKPKDKVLYTYDFGDGWQHEIVLEKVLAPEEAPKKLPVCLKGVRACPPEDCGGRWGYANLLEAIGNPKHPDHEMLKEWVGEYDPEAFDLDAVNAALARGGTHPLVF